MQPLQKSCPTWLYLASSLGMLRTPSSWQAFRTTSEAFSPSRRRQVILSDVVLSVAALKMSSALSRPGAKLMTIRTVTLWSRGPGLRVQEVGVVDEKYAKFSSKYLKKAGGSEWNLVDSRVSSGEDT